MCLEIQAKRGEIGKLEWFPANPSQILPTFCHGNKVKPWKFEKELPKLSFVWRERGRKEEKSCFAKKYIDGVNLSDFWQIQVKFYQLFATVVRWSLWKFEKKLPNLSFVWRERKKKAVLQRNSQKVTKSNAIYMKIGKSQKSQKSWNFIVRDERPRDSERFELSQAILWVK